MPSHPQPARTPLRKAPVCASLSARLSSSQTKKHPLPVNLFPRDEESTQSDNDDDDSLVAQRLPGAWRQPAKGPIRKAMVKARALQQDIRKLQCLLSDLWSRHAALSEHTYRPKWGNSWPSELDEAYKDYKRDDRNWRKLQDKFPKDCLDNASLCPGSPLFRKRLRETMKLGIAAVL
ncbi:hypothetical protein V8C44DRAFT_274553 [Trichoderma aethiopicum]